MLNIKKLLTKILNSFGTNTTYVQNSYGLLRLTKDKATNTVRCYGYFRSSTDIGISTVLFIVPSGYRPKEQRAVPMYLTTGGGITTSYYGYANTDGTIIQQLGASVRSGFFSDEWSV